MLSSKKCIKRIFMSFTSISNSLNFGRRSPKQPQLRSDTSIGPLSESSSTYCSKLIKTSMRFSLTALLLEMPPYYVSQANADDEKGSSVVQVGARNTRNKDFQHILNNSHFALFAQEQRYVNNGLLGKVDRSAGTELLIRIPNALEKGKYLNTEEFIIHVASMGQLDALTTKIIEKVIRSVALLDRANAPYYINVPPPLISPIFAKELALKLAEAGLSTKLIGIELTERETILDRAAFNAGMTELKRMGIPLALDDYGRGNSTQEFLIGLPVERIKIDRGAFCDAQKDSKLAEKLSSEIELMQKSGMEVIVEGIETTDDCTFALNLGCDGMQGYFFDFPKMLIPVDA